MPEFLKDRKNIATWGGRGLPSYQTIRSVGYVWVSSLLVDVRLVAGDSSFSVITGSTHSVLHLLLPNWPVFRILINDNFEWRSM